MNAPTSGLKPYALAVGALLVVALPWLAGDQYQLHLAALIAVYWILVAGLNLVIGYTGQISIGHVGLLAIGAYSFTILTGKLEWHPGLAVLVAGAVCGLCGLALGLPSLRLPGFYFAMATMAFALIVNELVLANDGWTGGGIGMPVDIFPAPFDTPVGYYYLVVMVALAVTLLTWNVVRHMWGLGLVSIRDTEVTAQAVGVPIFRVKLTIFVFSGIAAGVSGALFASLQSYITPDTFVFELSLFFFVSIIIGGRGSIVGPLLGTAVLTALPELVAPLAKLGNFFYGLLLLVVVLVVPEGIGRVFEVLQERWKPRKVANETVQPDLVRLQRALAEPGASGAAPPATALRKPALGEQA
ncbi:branched-chain amino acid ABC transporter permease [Hydrogenophaga sp. BPS33]|uniref:branched-chain amino acid ABC transporter permease n=1 Tax=Hydrogenophaga sp. BPS33 TaxID=2651974 RepID=UPI00131FC2EB|nr:branched-chain amino acid ABC transporter permease [Hydrogenophaga sp. BPS33]QHE86896.1 branched-chain amino acid ABC transporter permease [Hydrogenophaga sp. BPS33]